MLAKTIIYSMLKLGFFVTELCYNNCYHHFLFWYFLLLASLLNFQIKKKLIHFCYSIQLYMCDCSIRVYWVVVIMCGSLVLSNPVTSIMIHCFKLRYLWHNCLANVTNYIYIEFNLCILDGVCALDLYSIIKLQISMGIQYLYSSTSVLNNVI